MNSEKHKCVLEAVIKFEPCPVEDVTQLVPEYTPTEIKGALEDLKRRGFVTLSDESKRENRRIWDEDTVLINTDPFNIPDERQQGLDGEPKSEEEIIEANLPDSIETTTTLTLELTEDQTKLFERMRTDVSRTCGTMDENEFVDWVLREARRMTEV